MKLNKNLLKVVISPDLFYTQVFFTELSFEMLTISLMLQHRKKKYLLIHIKDKRICKYPNHFW